MGTENNENSVGVEQKVNVNTADAEGDLLNFLRECKKSAVEYRDRFKGSWDECEQQIRCVPPSSWALKEDWQTKIYIPMQAKKTEVAMSYLNKMIFGKGRNFDITGFEGSDSDNAAHLTDLIESLMATGNFSFENDFVLQESIDLGTGFIKMVMNPSGDGLVFSWRSAYQVAFDPNCRHNFDKARYVIDFHRKDLGYILTQARTKGSIYNKAKLQKFFDDANAEYLSAQKKSGQSVVPSGQTVDAFVVVKSIDGTSQISIPARYKEVDLDEYWVQVPQEDGSYQNRVITVLDDKYIIRNDENGFGFIPFQWCRVKPRKYDSYGKGYVENTRGLQELANSCINIGFDSLKMSSMDIVVINDNLVKDPLSIKYKPLAVWKMKDINAVKIQRQPVSAITDVIRGVTIIDQIDQDASGVTRQAQGAPDLSGAGTSSETLGEYQLKLQAIDQRFLNVGRFIEVDYFVPLLKKIFKVITNDKLFNQQMVDRRIGFKKQDIIETINGESKVVGQKDVSKLDIVVLRKIKEMDLDFKAVGVTKFSERLEVLAKLKEALTAALQNPLLTAQTKIDVLWKKIWQVLEIDDYDEFLRTKDEVQKLLSQNQPPQGAGVPGGAPIPGQPPIPAMAGR